MTLMSPQQVADALDELTNEPQMVPDDLHDLAVKLAKSYLSTHDQLKRLAEFYERAISEQDATQVQLERLQNSHSLLRQFVKEKRLMSEFGNWVASWGDLLPVEYGDKS